MQFVMKQLDQILRMDVLMLCGDTGKKCTIRIDVVTECRLAYWALLTLTSPLKSHVWPFIRQV